MDNNNNNLLFDDEHSNIKSQKFLYFFGGILHVIFFTGLLAYLICGISFLISDYKINSVVDNCYLWEYNLSYILLILIKLFLLKNGSRLLDLKFCNSLVILIIESLFLYFGTLIFINNNNDCNSLINTNLWFIGLCSLFIQCLNVIIFTYVIMILIIGELCKLKTPFCFLFKN